MWFYLQNALQKQHRRPVCFHVYILRSLKWELPHSPEKLHWNSIEWRQLCQRSDLTLPPSLSKYDNNLSPVLSHLSFPPLAFQASAQLLHHSKLISKSRNIPYSAERTLWSNRVHSPCHLYIPDSKQMKNHAHLRSLCTVSCHFMFFQIHQWLSDADAKPMRFNKGIYYYCMMYDNSSRKVYTMCCFHGYSYSLFQGSLMFLQLIQWK